MRAIFLVISMWAAFSCTKTVPSASNTGGAKIGSYDEDLKGVRPVIGATPKTKAQKRDEEKKEKSQKGTTSIP